MTRETAIQIAVKLLATNNVVDERGLPGRLLRVRHYDMTVSADGEGLPEYWEIRFAAVKKSKNPDIPDWTTIIVECETGTAEMLIIK